MVNPLAVHRCYHCYGYYYEFYEYVIVLVGLNLDRATLSPLCTVCSKEEMGHKAVCRMTRHDESGREREEEEMEMVGV